MNAEATLVFLAKILTGPLYALVLTGIISFFRKLVYVPFARKKYIREARSAGRVVTGRLIKTIPRLHDADKLVYQYEYMGKTYKYCCYTHGPHDETVELFFMKNPRKATVASSLGLHESSWLGMFLVLSVICSILALLQR